MLRNKNVHDTSTTPETQWKTTTTATGRKKRYLTTGKKQITKPDQIEQSRKAVWGNCPSFNFSDFDSFDLVVETSSETKAKRDSMEEKSSIARTPVSTHVKQKKNVCRPSLLRTPQIPEIPKVNLHAVNAFSTSIGSLPNSPVLEICSVASRLESTGYIHTSSPRVDSGFEADRSQSYNSSIDRCHSSHVNVTPLADISAISNVHDDPSILQNTPIDSPLMPSIDENSISDFSNIQVTSRNQNAGKRLTAAKMGRAVSPPSHQQSPDQISACDVSVNKQLDDMVKLTEQLSLISSTNDNSKLPESVTSHQTPKQYYTRQFAKSTQKHVKRVAKQCDVSKASLRCTPKAHTSLHGRKTTRSVTKSVRSEVSYDASQ